MAERPVEQFVESKESIGNLIDELKTRGLTETQIRRLELASCGLNYSEVAEVENISRSAARNSVINAKYRAQLALEKGST